jgi:hypothetical protein
MEKSPSLNSVIYMCLIDVGLCVTDILDYYLVTVVYIQHYVSKNKPVSVMKRDLKWKA